jgi:nicotinamide-nucleotide amidase
MNATLIIIGDEILSGNTTDTNSGFIASELKNIGIKVSRIFTIPDDVESISKTLKLAFEISDLAIATGGLGPTRDDKTKKAFADFFEDNIVFDETTFKHLEKYLEKRGRLEILELNREQAEILSSAKVFQNDFGTAPCQFVEKNEKIAVCLPGVPYEVKPLIKNKVIPYLKEIFSENYIISRNISVVGIPESLLAQKIENWELALPQHFSLSYLPIGTRIKLKITVSGADLQTLNSDLDRQISQLLPLIKNNVIALDSDKIEEILKHILIEKNLTISSAESCTGGEISRLITSVSGSSKYFLGGICTYQTEKKTSILSVSQELIREKSVVSAEVSEAMSLGCQKLFKTDISVSTTGVAGPNSDAENHAVGLAFYSVRIGENVETFRLFLPHFERTDFMNFVAQKVLQKVVELLLVVG